LEKLAMKKSLVALAVLAAAGAASAQSSVTLYGVADAWVGSAKRQNTVVTTVTPTGPQYSLASTKGQTLQDSGGLNGSRWGLRGSEDLGGGLKANFQIESGFDISTGAGLQGALFGRQAWVGLGGGFGEVRLGRQYSAYDELRGGTNVVQDSSFSPTAYAWGGVGSGAFAYGGDYNSRINNQIYYVTPNFGGFTGAVGYGLGENKTTASKASDTLSLRATYANGPLVVGGAYQQEKPQATPGNGKNQYALVSGSYDFGFLKLLGGVNTAKRRPGNAGAYEKDTEFRIGVDAPVGPVTISAGFAAANVKRGGALGLGGFKGTTNAFGLAAIYNLSKRTSVYAGLNVGKAKYKDVGINTTNDKSRLVAVGLRHRF
jgi:predicted porin